jgi:MFS family permease
MAEQGAAQEALSPLAPLRRPAYRMLWAVWLSANACMWMNDVAAVWMMTTLDASPLWVALVQTASNLPVFLLGLPSGALADSVDRRRYFLGTQLWVAVVALVLAGAVLSGRLTAPLLLALTFANGIGLALRWPVFAAIVPGLVPRTELAGALALNGVAMNASRILGPLLAGAIIAAAGSAWVFVLNALLSVGCALLILRWRYRRTPPGRAREPLGRAMRAALQFLAQSQRLRGVLLRIAVFFFHTSALLALLPLAARRLAGADAGGYTALLATMGCGAIAAAMLLPRLRRLLARERLVAAGALGQAGATLAVACAPNLGCAAAAMALEGAAWITTANALSVSAQLGLPDWVRARGMAMYQMAIMGSSAAGAAAWGQVAGLAGAGTAMTAAAATGAVAMLAVLRASAPGGLEDA